MNLGRISPRFDLAAGFSEGCVNGGCLFSVLGVIGQSCLPEQLCVLHPTAEEVGGDFLRDCNSVVNLTVILSRTESPHRSIQQRDSPKCLLGRGAKDRKRSRNRTDREQGQGQDRSISKYQHEGIMKI